LRIDQADVVQNDRIFDELVGSSKFDQRGGIVACIEKAKSPFEAFARLGASGIGRRRRQVSGSARVWSRRRLRLRIAREERDRQPKSTHDHEDEPTHWNEVFTRAALFGQYDSLPTAFLRRFVLARCT
jgi:hypothetical protein